MISKVSASFLLLITLHFSPTALGWGERGHHVIAHEAARLIKYIESKSEKKKGLGVFFNDRSIQLGHLSNIPDTSWKIFTRKRVKDTNFSTHFIDPEVVLGVPKTEREWSKFPNKIRRLPADFTKAVKKYEGSKNLLPAKKGQKVNFYKEVGVAPWHIQYLYDEMVKALSCGRKKAKKKTKKVFSSDVKLALKKSESPVYPTYECDKKSLRENDFHTAVAFAGILSHFVGDLAQPHHTSANYDGWYTGHGKYHVYFESLVVQMMGEDLNAEVAKLARDPKFQKEVWQEIGLPLSRRKSIAQLSLNLAAQSNRLLPTLEKLDNTYAIIQKGTPIPWGANRKKHPAAKAPERKPADNITVQEAFRPIIVRRLAVGTFVLSKIWMQAWKDAKKPDLVDFNAVSFPYLFDVPFIWPDYAKKVL